PGSSAVSLRRRDEALQAPLRAEHLLAPVEHEPRRRLYRAELHPADGIDLAAAHPGFRAAHDLEELDLVGDALQTPPAERHELHVRRAGGFPPERFAHQNLMTARLGGQTRRDVHGDAEVVAFAVEHRAVMTAAPHGR